MALFDTARSIYLSLCDDPQAIESLRAAASTLAVAIATDENGAATITSGTMNGQNFAMSNAMKPTDRLRVLRMVCQMADAGMVPSKTVTPVFTPSWP